MQSVTHRALLTCPLEKTVFLMGTAMHEERAFLKACAAAVCAALAAVELQMKSSLLSELPKLASSSIFCTCNETFNNMKLVRHLEVFLLQNFTSFFFF